jgi:hypothetical protein
MLFCKNFDFFLYPRIALVFVPVDVVSCKCDFVLVRCVALCLRLCPLLAFALCPLPLPFAFALCLCPLPLPAVFAFVPCLYSLPLSLPFAFAFRLRP